MGEGLLDLPRPDHVPSDRVVDFDLYDMPLTNIVDPQSAYLAFRDNGPDIFWTPRNGGHWVLTRSEDVQAVQQDDENFTRVPQLAIPPVPTGRYRHFPIQSDPPEHGAFRRPLVQALQPAIVDAMSDTVTGTVAELIEGFVDQGECEFVGAFAQVFPIRIFMALVDLPPEDRAYLLPLADTAARAPSVERRLAASKALFKYLIPFVERRREQPGTDLMSKLVNISIGGQKISFEDAMGYMMTVTVAGLDTVAATLSFVARHFALHPQHRREMPARYTDDAYCRRVVEELLRRYAVANSTRVVREDMIYKGIAWKKGEVVLVPNLFIGLDDRVVPYAMDVDLDRPRPNPHAAFDVGIHTCPGATLARRELRIFLREWFSRIPDFGITPGTAPRMATGMVNGMTELHLVWPATDRA